MTPFSALPQKPPDHDLRPSGKLHQLDGRDHFSRPGGQIVCQYYNFLRLGREGYKKVHEACYHSASYLAEQIAQLGPFEIVFDGDMSRGIPAVSWKLKDGADPGFTLFDLADRLRARGWQVPAYTLPANCSNQAVQRILVRNGVSRDLSTLLMNDMIAAIEHLEAYPRKVSLTAEEGSGFSH